MGQSGVTQVYEFNQQLKLSAEAEDLPIWDGIYDLAFERLVRKIHSYRRDMEMQKRGIDRGIELTSGQEVYVDEKVRFRNRNGNVYDDIALEYISVEEQNVPGWVCKPGFANHYIAYLIAPLGRVYLLPMLNLHLAWLRNGAEWLVQHGSRQTATERAGGSVYHTRFCPVPARALYQAIGATLRVPITPFETPEDARSPSYRLKPDVGSQGTLW